MLARAKFEATTTILRIMEWKWDRACVTSNLMGDVHEGLGISCEIVKVTTMIARVHLF